MKNLTWQNPEQLFVAQELINKVKSKCCGIKDEQIKSHIVIKPPIHQTLTERIDRKMKAKHIVVYLLLAIVSSSCIREEALNAEADILSCALPGVAMTTSPIINNNSITIFVGPGTDISELTPEFTLTPGATINPLSGTERNFNTPQEYTVTAADGVWKKTYIISVIDTELATNYNFEDTLGGKKYYIFVEREGGKVVIDRKSTRLNSSHNRESRMPSSA